MRSLIFNIVFYLNLTVMLIAALPTFFMPYWGIVGVAKAWGRVNLFWLRVICGLDAEFRGREKMIVHAVDLASARRARGGRDHPRKTRVLRDQPVAQCALAGTRRTGEHQQHGRSVGGARIRHTPLQ